MEAATCQGFLECDSIIPTSLPLEPVPIDNIAIAIYKQATCAEYKKGGKNGGEILEVSYPLIEDGGGVGEVHAQA